jgi:hypothetical protein
MLLPCPHRAFAADGLALAGSSMIFLPEPKLNNKSTEYIQEFIKKFLSSSLLSCIVPKNMLTYAGA